MRLCAVLLLVLCWLLWLLARCARLCYSYECNANLLGPYSVHVYALCVACVPYVFGVSGVLLLPLPRSWLSAPSPSPARFGFGFPPCLFHAFPSCPHLFLSDLLSAFFAPLCGRFRQCVDLPICSVTCSSGLVVIVFLRALVHVCAHPFYVLCRVCLCCCPLSVWLPSHAHVLQLCIVA